ncbi:MAG: HAMP domain-containing sensor histidine kinase [Pseudomonadota bacterium]|nr:HAMP domain-containing sensor histidine kinase [Pseudomonadota bacterium]
MTDAALAGMPGPRAGQDWRIDRLTGEFSDSAAEAAFARHTLPGTLGRIKAMVIALAVALPPLVLAEFLELGFGMKFWIGQVGTLSHVVIAGAMVWAVYRRPHLPLLHRLVLLQVLTLAADVALMAWTHPARDMVIIMQNPLLVLVGYILLPLPMRQLFLAISTVVVIAILCDLFAYGLSLPEQLGLITWLILSHGIGAFAARQLNRHRRVEFASGQERALAVEQMARAKEEAERANTAKSAFMANMSHELRTPLNAVIGFSEMLTLEVFGPVGDHRYREYANDIHSSGRHLLDLIDDLLDLSRIEAGKLVLTESEIDLAAIVEECVRIVQPRASTNGVQVAVSDGGAECTVRADQRAMRQVMLNLIGNAVKFTGAGGRVDISCACSPATGVSIVVADTGNGIAPDKLERIFKPFEQDHNSKPRDEKGWGLGLPIAQALVGLHDGTIRIESVVGKGTTVSVVLPAERLAGVRRPESGIEA